MNNRRIDSAICGNLWNHTGASPGEPCGIRPSITHIPWATADEQVIYFSNL